MTPQLLDRLLVAQSPLQWSQTGLAETDLEKVVAFGLDEVYRLPAVEATCQAHVEISYPPPFPAGTKKRFELLRG
jgi:hypothetical protein